MNDIPFNTLLGKTLVAVTGKKGDDEITFKTSDGESFQLYHEQDCCENVSVEDICGDWEDIMGEPILLAEEISSHDAPPDLKPEYQPDSMTWSFYKLATNKGSVTIRWLGESNGWYSESVYFTKL